MFSQSAGCMSGTSRSLCIIFLACVIFVYSQTCVHTHICNCINWLLLLVNGMLLSKWLVFPLELPSVSPYIIYITDERLTGPFRFHLCCIITPVQCTECSSFRFKFKTFFFFINFLRLNHDNTPHIDFTKAL